MKLLKKACFAIVFTGVMATTLQCASSKEVAANFEDPTSFKVNPVYFQEWYAGIKVGGTGINLFIPIAKESQDITIDSVYFRNLKGKLVKKEGKYIAILKNKSLLYTFTKADKPADYPFTLGDNECAISYIENGQTKYMKISNINELAGTYYEKGPPSIYTNSSTTILAASDEDEDGK